jgi:hypothetical protein
VSLSSSLLGCATLSVTQHTKDLLQPVRYARAVRDGQRLVILYEIGVLHLEAAPEAVTATWGTLDLDRIRWMALDRLADIPLPLIEAPLPATFLSAEEGAPPELPVPGSPRDVALVEMPGEEQTTRERERDYLRRAARARPLSLITVTKQSWPARLFLVMQKADHLEPLVARVEAPVRTYLAPSGLATRLALYPLAIAGDIVTAPVQVILFLLSTR